MCDFIGFLINLVFHSDPLNADLSSLPLPLRSIGKVEVSMQMTGTAYPQVGASMWLWPWCTIF